MAPGTLVKAKREQLGLTQRQLALRAGMTQAAVSRIERGVVSPTFATVRQLMLAMGEEPELSSRRLRGRWDPTHVRAALQRKPRERLALAASWQSLAARLAAAGRVARHDG